MTDNESTPSPNEKKRANDKAWRAAHREERRAYMAAWRAAHAEQISRTWQQWYLMHQEKQCAKAKTQREAHPEQTKQRNKAWRDAHPGKSSFYQAKRKARARGLPDTFMPAHEQFCRQYFHYACAVCEQEEGFTFTLALDHWIPLSSPTCPGTVASNIVVLCHGEQGCNNSKQDKDPSIWLLRKFGKHKAATILKKIEAYFAVVLKHSAPREEKAID